MIERLFLFQFPVLLCQFLLELFNLIFLLFALSKLFFNLFRHRFVGSLIFLKRLLPSSIFAADPKELSGYFCFSDLHLFLHGIVSLNISFHRSTLIQK